MDFTTMFTFYYESSPFLFLILSIIFGTLNLIILMRFDDNEKINQCIAMWVFLIILVTPIYSYCEGVEYVMHNTNEYQEGYNDFPNNTTYNNILKIESLENSHTWGANEHSLKANEYLYKNGWEDHYYENEINVKNNEVERLRNDL